MSITERPTQARIAILDDYQQVALELACWSSLPREVSVVVFTHPAKSEDELIRRLVDFDIVVAMRERTVFNASLLSRLPRLRLIASTGLRNAAIDLDACDRLGITVCGARGTKNGLASTAEIAWSLILALHKKTIASHQALCSGSWQPEVTEPLCGRTLGLIGLGNIGRQMARIWDAFGMEVIAWSPNLTEERAANVGVRSVDKKTLLSLADVVSLHLVMAPETTGILAAQDLALMKSTAYVVNTARAGLIDEQALLEALSDRRIGGAGLDVFWCEPILVTHPLCSMRNVVLSPHLGYVTRDNLGAFYTGALDNIKCWLAGGIPLPMAG